MSHVFSVIGLNHGHINGQVKGLLDTSKWKLKHVYAAEEDLLQNFAGRYPDAIVAESIEQVLEDDEVELMRRLRSMPIEAHLPCGFWKLKSTFLWTNPV